MGESVRSALWVGGVVLALLLLGPLLWLLPAARALGRRWVAWVSAGAREVRSVVPEGSGWRVTLDDGAALHLEAVRAGELYLALDGHAGLAQAEERAILVLRGGPERVVLVSGAGGPVEELGRALVDAGLVRGPWTVPVGGTLAALYAVPGTVAWLVVLLIRFG